MRRQFPTLPTPKPTFLQNAVNQFPIIYYVALSGPDGVQSEARKQMPVATVYSQEKNNQSEKCGRKMSYRMNIKLFFQIRRRNGDFYLPKAITI